MMLPTARRALREQPATTVSSSCSTAIFRRRRRSKARGGRGVQRRTALQLRSRMGTPTWSERFTNGLFGIFGHLRRLASFSNLCEYEPPVNSHHALAEEEDDKLQATLENLRRRIEDTPMEGRRTPMTSDPDILGRELKIRLAGMTPVLEEKVLDNGQVQVIEHYPPWRIVPLYKIVNRGDPKVQGHVKVNMPP